MSGLVCPPGIRWDCVGCGACCRVLVRGPVEPERFPFLDTLGRPWREVGPHPTLPGDTATFLAGTADGCVFLDGRRGCEVHRVHGLEAKPGFCRAFPFAWAARDGQVMVTVRPECVGAGATSVGGTPLEDRLLQLGSGWMVPRAEPAEPVPLLPGVGVSRSDWYRMEDAVVRAVDASCGGPGAWVATIRDLVFRAMGKDGFVPDARRHAAGMAEVVSRIGLVLQDARALPPPEPGHQPRYLLLAEVLATATTAAQQPDPPLEGDVRTFLAGRLVQAIRSRHVLTTGSLFAGLGRFLLETTLAVRFAGGADCGAVGRAVAGVATVLEHPALRRTARPFLVDLALHAT